VPIYGPRSALSISRSGPVQGRDVARSYSDQYHSSPGTGMEYAGYVEPGGYDRMVFRGDPTVRADADPEFIAFWVARDRVLAAMNVNIWDVQDDLQKLVRAGIRAKASTWHACRTTRCRWETWRVSKPAFA
jgi:3-phenylpropionate/trans-cinnamate dioxygenase ferredoxin reductase component